jgi:hypothetical protein
MNSAVSRALVAVTGVAAISLSVLVILADHSAPREVTALRAGAEAGTVDVVVSTTDNRGGRYVLREDGRFAPDQYHQPVGGPIATSPSCFQRVCFRVVPGRLAIEQSHDGGRTYSIAWEHKTFVYDDLLKQYAKHKPADPSHATLESRSVLVVPHASGGYVVFVANGFDGLLYRDSAGRWERLGSPDNGPGWFFDDPPRLITDPKPLPFDRIVGGLIFLIVLTTGLIQFRRYRTGRWLTFAELFGTTVLVAGAAAIATHLPLAINDALPLVLLEVPGMAVLTGLGMLHAYLLCTPSRPSVPVYPPGIPPRYPLA